MLGILHAGCVGDKALSVAVVKTINPVNYTAVYAAVAKSILFLGCQVTQSAILDE